MQNHCDPSFLLQMWPTSAYPTFFEGVIEVSVGAVLFPLAFHTLK